MTEITIIDKILRRKQLKQKIKELNKRLFNTKQEIQELKQELNKKEQERKKAITDKQEAYEKRNKLQDKVNELTDKIETIQQSNTNQSTHEIKKQTITDTNNIQNLYNNLKNYQMDSCLSLKVTEHGTIPEYFKDELNTQQISFLQQNKPGILYIDTEKIMQLFIKPPIFPQEPIESESSTFYIKDEWLLKENEEYAFVLARSDMFVSKIYNSNSKTDYNSFITNIERNHSKGGFSQSRFENRRDEQIDEHISKINEKLQKLQNQVNTIILTGDKQIINKFKDDLSYTYVTDASGEPKQALNKSYADFWSVEVYNL